LEDIDKEKLKREIDELFKDQKELEDRMVSSEPLEEIRSEKESPSTADKNPLPEFKKTEHFSSATKSGSGHPIESPYEILSRLSGQRINEQSSDSDIKRVYRNLAQKYHPDLRPGDTNAHGWFTLVNAAYEAISSPELRESYKRKGYGSVSSTYSEPGISQDQATVPKSYIDYWSNLAAGSRDPLSASIPGIGPSGSRLSPYFGFSEQNLDSKSPQNAAYMDYLRGVERRQELVDRSPICICKTPLFERGYSPKWTGSEKCTRCRKLVTPRQLTSPVSRRETHRNLDIKGLGPGMGKVR
jgi:curved DNA-binding protein CbpA